MNKKVTGIIAAIAMTASLFSTSFTAFAQDVDSAEEQEIPEGAIFEEVTWTSATVYAYTPSVLTNATMLTPVIFVYPDERLEDIDAAWDMLCDTGLLDIAEEENAGVFLFTPVEDTWSASDNYVWMEIATALTTVDYNPNQFTYTSYLNMLYVMGEGSGASFINQYLARNERADIIAGIITVGGELSHPAAALPSREVAYDYPLPAYLVNATDETIDFYKDINEVTTTEEEDGKTIYYNDERPSQKMIVMDSDADGLTKDIVQDGWSSLLRRTARGCLSEAMWIAGVRTVSIVGGTVLTDRPNIDELDLIRNDYVDEDIIESELEEYDATQSRWYEWIPSEVYDTLDDDSDMAQYPLVLVYHGGGDHPIFEAESQGWVALAGDERFIVVAPEDNGDPDNNVNFLNYLCDKYPVDVSKIYVVGFSNGAVCTVNTISAHMDRFAAAASLAYSGDGEAQRWLYDEYGWDTSQIDIPVMYSCGTKDVNNSLPNLDDPDADRVFSAQYYINDILTLNDMTDQLIDVDNLDFESYPYYGYDVSDLTDSFETADGVTVNRTIYRNEEGAPMAEYLVLPGVHHNHYTAYAEIVWDFFKNFSRDAETGEIIYSPSEE